MTNDIISDFIAHQKAKGFTLLDTAQQAAFIFSDAAINDIAVTACQIYGHEVAA